MVLIELKINKNLLDIKFEGYKLSLDPIPVLKQPLNEGVKCIELGEEDYSYLQTRLNLLLNHLFQDPWDQNSIFYVNKKNNVIWTSLCQDGRLSIPRCVWNLTLSSPKEGNITISFPNPDWAILCDGIGSLYILYTPSRTAGEPWMCHHKFDLKKTSAYYLLNTVYRNIPGGQQIDCVIATVTHKSKLPDNFEYDGFVSMIEWISFTCGQNLQSWILKRKRKLAGSSFPEYVAIDNIEDAICVISQNEFTLYYDSEGLSYPKSNLESTGIKKYTYIQTPEDISVYFRLEKSIQRCDIQVKFKPLSLEVLIKGKTVVTGELANYIDSEESTWILNGDKLEVILYKSEVGLMWQELIKGNKEGEELFNKELVEEIHARLAHLTSDSEVIPSNKVPFNLQQLEECDSSVESLTFQRIDGNEHIETHKINLGGHQWLFNEQINPQSMPAICLRYDVDGILWQPKKHFK